MDPQKRRRIVAVVVVLVGLVGLGGVIAASVADRSGSDNLGADPVAAVRAAAPKVQGKRLRADLSISTGGTLQFQAGQRGVYDAAKSQADVILDGLPSGPIRLVVDGTVLYGMPAAQVDGKPWGRIDLADAGQLGQGPAAVSPSQIDELFGVLTSVRTAQDKGREKIEGATLRHYTAVVDPAAVSGASSLFARSGAATPTVDVWLDDDGAPRRLAIASEVASVKVMVVARIRAIDVSDPIGVPPAADVAQVEEITELLGRARG